MEDKKICEKCKHFVELIPWQRRYIIYDNCKYWKIQVDERHCCDNWEEKAEVTQCSKA